MTLAWPLSFAVLILAAAFAARAAETALGLPADQPLGQLAWILAPALLGLAWSRLDPARRGQRLFRLDAGVLLATAMAAVGAVLVVAAVTGLGLAAGGLAFPKGAALAPAVFATVAVSALLSSTLEEVGWRGYLLPALLSRTGYWATIALAAAVWFVWHLPFIDRLTLYTDEAPATLLVRLAVGVLALQLLFTEVFLATRSVWVAAALHAAFNVTAGAVFASGAMLTGAAGWIVSPSADGLVLMALASAAALGMRRRRLAGEARLAS